MSVSRLDANCLGIVVSYLEEESKKEFLANFSKVDQVAAASLLKLPDQWKARLTLDPQIQAQIQMAAFFPTQPIAPSNNKVFPSQ